MTPKECAALLGNKVNFRGHEYTLTALIKRHTPKGVIWQLELLWMNDNVRSVVISGPKEVNINDRIK